MNPRLRHRLRANLKRLQAEDRAIARGSAATAVLPGEVIEGEAAWLLFNSARQVSQDGRFITVAVGADGAARLGVFDTATQRLALFEGPPLLLFARQLFADVDALDAALELDTEEA